ncbi:4-carboxy-4-hydroxy-2-oxoadipate aldolase/oxaloacetate decarboxylase [Ketogulonicigenium vulgare]|nr:4-carboxy-4-hydroxy-2-oxoadipate aldolase/oxaloacetate decarboxylase [Ketogulonicigenium vulgare]
MAHVRRSFTRPSPEAIDAIRPYSPATVHEAQGKLGALDSRIKPLRHGWQICGSAITAQCHIGDNLMIFEAINLAKPGDVLVLSAGNNPEQGGFGDVLAAACRGKGIAGLIIDAGVRDGRGLRAGDFPVFSLGLCVKGTSKDTLGTVNMPVMVGNQLITPGDIIVADDDGVVVVRQEPFALAKACEAREASEAKLIEMHLSGRMEIEDRYDMMRAKGCVWED